jgi:hypothetical protein
VVAAGAAALPAISRMSWGQAYPTRPVRIIVPSAHIGDAKRFKSAKKRWRKAAGGQWLWPSATPDEKQFDDGVDSGCLSAADVPSMSPAIRSSIAAEELRSMDSAH